MKETGRESSQKNKDLRENRLDLFDHLHHIETLMMPMKINGNDPRRLLSDIFNDGKTLILNPLHSEVDNLGRDPLSLKKVGQSKESHR